MASKLLSGAGMALLLLVGCKAAAPTPAGRTTEAGADVPAIAAFRQSEASPTGVNAAVLVRFPGGWRLVSAAGLAGLGVDAADGKRLATLPAGESTAVAVALPATPNGETVVAALDLTHGSVRLFALRGEALAEVGARPFPLGFAAEGACFFRHPLDKSLHLFVVGDGGEIDQQVVYPGPAGTLDLRPVRRIHVPSTLKQCVADAQGQVYASEEAVGVWRFQADPESDTGATLIDTPRLGHLKEESGGVALVDQPQRQWLLAADTSAGRINVYDRSRDDAFLGAFSVRAPGEGEPVEEPGPLHAIAPSPAFPSGVLVVTDEDGANAKFVHLDAIARALKSTSGGSAASAATVAAPAAVSATVETTPVASYGDAADDPAIWADPVDPAHSAVIATDKKAGLVVYDMLGQVLQFLPDGKMNNVDLREDFPLGGRSVVLVTATNRTDKTIAIYRFDTVRRQLVDVADGPQPTGMDDPYGLCMYREPKSGKTYVFVNGDETAKRQWELQDAGNGRVRAQPLREMSFDSQTEGCVADDAAGTLFVDEEDVAMWRMPALAQAGTGKVAAARVDNTPALKDDLEGLGIYDLGDGRGYIVVSTQGNDTYAVFRREGKQEYLGSFAVVADPVRGIDGISETDGLEVSSRNLGPGFEHGAMVAQDGRNVMPVENQNYKMVPWSAIAAALKLESR